MAYRATIGDRVRVTQVPEDVADQAYFLGYGELQGRTGTVDETNIGDFAPEGAFYVQLDGDDDRVGLLPNEVEVIEYATLGTENAA